MFLVAKKGGGQRPALDLSPLNKFIPTEHFKMENLMTIKSLINKEDCLPMHPDSQKLIFLRFLWQGRSYQLVTMPFSLNVAPRGFAKFLKLVIATRPGCSNDYFSRRYTCARSNSRNNKSTRTYDFKPTRVITVSDQLQKVISSSNTDNLPWDAHRLGNDEICLTTEKSENIQRECRDLLKTQPPSIRQISRN